MVDSKRRNSGDDGTRDDVRAIVCSAYSDFKNGGIDLVHKSVSKSYEICGVCGHLERKEGMIGH